MVEEVAVEEVISRRSHYRVEYASLKLLKSGGEAWITLQMFMNVAGAEVELKELRTLSPESRYRVVQVTESLSALDL